MRWKQGHVLQSSQCLARHSGVPQTPLLARGGLAECLSVQVREAHVSLGGPRPGPCAVMVSTSALGTVKAKLWISQRKEVIGPWVWGAEAGRRQEP